MAFADIFSPVAFFICLREVLEAGIIIAVLLGFINQIIPPTGSAPTAHPSSGRSSTELLAHPDTSRDYGAPLDLPTQRHEFTAQSVRRRLEDGSPEQRGKMIRAMRLQIWSGSILGGLIAALIGGVFLFVFYHYTHDLWQDAENLWEGGFCLIASILILIMGLAFLRLPQAQTKWRLKLLSAYKAKRESDDYSPTERGDAPAPLDGHGHDHASMDGRSKRGGGGRMILFGLPLITVLREGLEGVVFLGGIGLSESPPAVAGGALAGAIVGGAIAYALFSSSAPMPLRTFTTTSSILLFMIGAGLASRAAYSLERQYFINGVGAAAAESGSGPGSYRVEGNIWKLPYGNPEPGAEDGSGWAQLAQSIVGWNNVGTVCTVSTYIGYWWVIIVTLVSMKWKEGRTAVCGVKSRRGWQREWVRREDARQDGEDERLLPPAEG